MRRIILFCCILSALSIPLFSATVGQVDTFQSGTTAGWFAGGLGMGMVPPVPPHVVFGGGPAGAGDNYLLITAIGGSDAGSRLVAINVAQWAGNYLTSGISGITMDLINLGNSDLNIRLLLEDPMGGPPVDEAVSTNGFFLPTGGGWTHAFFPISSSDLTAVDGSVNAVLANTTLLRIINSPTATDATTVVGVLGVDNITAVPEPATWLPLTAGLVVLAVRRR
jgi:hypothetical protein